MYLVEGTSLEAMERVRQANVAVITFVYTFYSEHTFWWRAAVAEMRAHAFLCDRLFCWELAHIAGFLGFLNPSVNPTFSSLRLK